MYYPVHIMEANGTLVEAVSAYNTDEAGRIDVRLGDNEFGSGVWVPPAHVVARGEAALLGNPVVQAIMDPAELSLPEVR